MPPRVTPFATAGEAVSAALAGITTKHREKEVSMTKQRRGFACMDVEKRRAIARKGGAAVDPAKRSFSRDRTLAADAGRKGGETSRGGGRKPALARG